MNIDDARRQQFYLIQEHKAGRRMQIAPDVSVLWESETTIDHQVAEMLWQEENPDARENIKQSYEELRPRLDKMTAAISIEIEDAEQIHERLHYYAGLAMSCRLTADQQEVPARVIVHQESTAEAAPLTYVAFDLPTDWIHELSTLQIDHPHLQGSWPIPANMPRL